MSETAHGRMPGSLQSTAAREGRDVGVAVLVFVVALATIASLFNAVDPVHHDMTEAWAWGQEFQLGYDKHPPLFAWVAGAWFAVLPRTSVSFYVLASLVSAVGLLGVAHTARRVIPTVSPVVPVLLLMLTPGFTILALRYNANSALLLTWPWAIAILVSALEKPTAFKGVALGVVLALAMLTKYFSVVLVIVCLVASILHPNRAVIWRSSAPFLAVLTGIVVLTPHLLWLLSSERTPIGYAMSIRKEFSTLQPALRNGLLALASQIAATAGVLILANLRSASDWRRLLEAAIAPRHAWATWLALGPSLIAALLAVTNHVPHSTLYLIPAFAFLPTALLLGANPQLSAEATSKTARVVASLWLVALIVQGGLLANRIRTGQPEADPGYDLTELANDAWSSELKLPLAIVCGRGPIATAIAFYSASHPSYWSCFDPAATPWVTKQKLRDNGFLVVCEKADPVCMQALDKHRKRAIRVTEVSSRRTGRMLPATDLKLVVLVAPPAGLLD